MARAKSLGFTLVELIVVIILVAIVSLYAASRFIGRDSFSAFVAQEQVISVIRQVQVTRMQSNSASSCASDSNTALSVSANCLGSVAGCNQASAQRSDWVALEGVTFSPQTACLEFDLLGEPNQAVTVDIRAASSTCRVTIERNGYVSSGGCS
ncbi:prepilin-type N-terminal cleavage/methylation domain-containing protein [Vibrio sinaloensis]|uniref:prepilin-type N-terminal cleavage/methylation domain-containing protein n=1 Tax=Photobacterium sp. (strain ATCC 43367) TaxID=379097 RepID=UPI002047CA33|nr:prepilin-type N-terminal cleavage/methylation domain-containing protein [Vibrio sinaloensis]UPQ88299.1 prepilin-type N-terminal cleavage/methylation domain-containing protein [Vibrio sinaloensis]